ncbi:P-loop NTPase fold protein [Bacillus subtilis]|uniref:P-loop NTPase fold protein n=1 Tax=Bacillus subtilis TaxID=1423 RepID=UPI000DC5A525|nr:P-loop NTPase fold protein [Bacillus subtilis]MDI6587217.1 hypothetical protein [Bacillus subtilis]MDM5457976.1 hypothetical protein [Bacillus subtilis]QGI05135.1 hypothetical protein GII78_11310 [Bacillus subtilis]RAP10687.1 hypothetical protein HS3_01106 [Bacillus subtilis]
MKANEIVEVLEKFKDSAYQKILINGEWGIGKTKYVVDFTKQSPNTCYISLFGKKDVDNIIHEIYFKLIENDQMGKIKESYKKITEKLNKINFSFSGVSLTVPLLNDVYSSMQKELSKKSTYIVIFDDLERKHDSLGIKEVFGLIDSLSNIEGIKTVLIAATEHFNDESKEVFTEYKEKAIDRSYLIEKYSDKAPQEILGELQWKTLKNTAEFLTFKNLRTFQKTKLFIDEVLSILGEEVFTEKFTREDVYRMCFATTVFNIEHNGEMRLMGDKRPSEYSEAAVVGYMCGYILKNSLDNIMSKNVLLHIKKWFEVGEYSKQDILKEIKIINEFQEGKPNNFYSSDHEIFEYIEKTKKYLRELKGNESLGEITTIMSNGITWSEVLSYNFELETKDILSLIKPNIKNHLDIQKSVYENEISLSQFILENKKAKEVIGSVNQTIKFEYYKKLVGKIKECFTNANYDIYYLKQLADSINSINSGNIRSFLMLNLEENQFFFALPAGSITQEQWDWCIISKMLVFNIHKSWNMNKYYDNFVESVKIAAENIEDHMLHYRLKNLFEGNY